jgi:preprotein translocase subunit SecF
MYQIIQNKKIWLTISCIMVVISLLSLFIWGLKFNIDFTGGSLIEIQFVERVLTNNEINQALAELKLPYLNVQPTGDKAVIIKTETLTEIQHQQILKNLLIVFNPEDAKKAESIEVTPEQIGLSGEGLEGVQITATGTTAAEIKSQQNLPYLNPVIVQKYLIEQRFDSIGPTIGKELQQKSIYALIIVNLAIIFYIAFAFRKVSKPVESWKYGVAAVIALIHDVLCVIGLFSVLGHFFNYQVDSLFIIAILTILGFSVHDTIVTFDRTRENLHHHLDKTFEEVVNLSVNETLVRSINTSLTTFLTLFSIFLFGGDSLKHFVLALMFGIIIGTYSSIFIASPLLLIFYKLKKYK